MKIIEQARLAKEASLRVASSPLEQKNRALSRATEFIQQNREIILSENRKDLKQAEMSKLTESLYKRLILNDRKIDQLVAGIEGVIRLPDPVGRVQLERELDQDLLLTRVSVPIGVIGVIFESRPDVLVQISSLCLKSGNAAILKGGSEALYSNRILFELLRRAAEETDTRFKGSLQLVETREDIRELLKLDQYIDLMIPRGSNELVKSIQENTRIPVLGHTGGVCHLYIDREADPEMAVEVAYDAKCQYPAVCNSIETLLVHKDLAAEVLPLLAEKLNMVELRGRAIPHY
ncbi:MAG TPA: glutamate-5-semialdehyde dehydrogenase [Spirochaetales bacterium]|nr:glutamate-5-semialdehyde dehydrogenase [Spirochaetales bacterium]